MSKKLCNFIVLCIIVHLSLLLLAVVGALPAQIKTKPVRLTGQENNFFKISVAAFDQCFPAEETNTFGLEFRLPLHGGSCDDSIIICYPSALATRTLDNLHIVGELSVNSEQFNLNKKTSMDHACQEVLEQIEHKKNVGHWHAFRVYTEQILNGNESQRVLKLSRTSLEDKNGTSYTLRGAYRQFVIHFGNANNPFTYLTTNFGEHVEIDDEDRLNRDAYKKLAPEGAPLNKFVGFWTLGIDMLPWNTDMLELYVVRGCNCSIEAWFIRPTDSEPEDPEIPSAGNIKNNCTAHTKKSVNITNKIEADTLIYIRLLTRAQIKSISFTLYANDSDELGPMMNFAMYATTKNHTKLTKIAMRKSSRIDLILNNNFSNPDVITCSDFLDAEFDGTREMIFKIVFTNYTFGIIINDHLPPDGDVVADCNHEFFPNRWWLKLPLNKMTSFELEGDFLILNDPPPVMRFVTLDKNYESQYVTLPYNMTMPRTQTEIHLKFRIKLNNPKHYGVKIVLLHNRPVLQHESIGATVMEMDICPENITMQSRTVKNRRSTEYTLAFVNYSLPNDVEAIEIQIAVYKDNIDIHFNGKYVTGYTKSLMPPDTTNFIRVEEVGKGNITLLEEPSIMRESTDKRYMNFTTRLFTVLNYGDKIGITFKLTYPNKQLSIFLMHESLEFDRRLGDVLLALIFDFDAQTVACKHFLHEDNLANMIITDSGVQYHRLNKYGQVFDLEIICEKKQFEVYIDHVGFAMNCSYPIPFKFTGSEAHRYPPWAVDHIRIEETFGNKKTVVKNMNIWHSKIVVTEEHVRNFIEVDDATGVLRAGDLISVTLPIIGQIDQATNINVSVNLMYEALRLHPIVGKTIMSLKLNDSKLFYLHTKNQSVECNISMEIETWKELHFQIQVTEDGFNVKLNNMNTSCYIGNVSVWAVQYITVEHNDVSLGEPKLMCEPHKRCLAREEFHNYFRDL